MRRRTPHAIAAGAFITLGFLGCNAILGNESAVFEPSAGTSGGTATTEGGPVGDSTIADVVLPDGANPDAGPCVNLDSNPNHCGACFHDCLGGACTAGKCQPVKLQEDMGKPLAINVDATHVYWNNLTTGNITRVAKAGGSADIVFGAPASTFSGKQFGIYQGRVYFARSGTDEGIYSCPVTGCPATGPTTIIPALTSPDFVSIDGNMLVFAEARSGGIIGRCELPSCASVETLLTNGEFVLRAAAQMDVVVWSRLIPQGAVQARVNGGAVTTLVPNVPTTDIALVGTTQVYFARRDNGMYTVQIDGGGLRPLTGEATQTEYFRIVGSEVFFPDSRSSTGRVVQCALTGCADAGVTLASNQATPRAVAVDDKAVYFTNEGAVGDNAGSIYKVAR